MHIGVCDGGCDDDNPAISPSTQTITTDNEDDEENQQELGGVYNTSTTIENLPIVQINVERICVGMKETGIQ